jgi:hypothetical protein
MNNKTKKSQLVFDPKMCRKLLKMNDEIKFCPFCGKPVADGCACHKNIVVDVKPYRGIDNNIVPDRSVLVFHNNVSFQADYNQMIEEAKAKKETEEPEQLSVDFD